MGLVGLGLIASTCVATLADLRWGKPPVIIILSAGFLALMHQN
jgi:hypothetical protein